jgi:hypothetical protein
VTSLPPLIAQTEFRPSDVPRVVALVTAVSQAAYAFAPAAFGLLRDFGGAVSPRTGDILLFAFAALVQVASAVAMLPRSASHPAQRKCCRIADTHKHGQSMAGPSRGARFNPGGTARFAAFL